MFSYLPEMRNTEKHSIGGLTSGRLIGKIVNKLFPLGDPSNILIHVGTNDVNSLNISAYEANMRLVIEKIRLVNPSCTVILSSVLPRLVDFRLTNLKVTSFNEKLKDLANSFNNVKYMACEKSFFDRTYGRPISALFSKDKLHLSVAGLNKIYSFIANTLAHL